VAVKQLFNESQQSIDEFLNEIVLITGVKHRNLVKLKGCCITTLKKRLLVYEYVENNDLEQALFVGKGKHMLNWPLRFNICLGMARGLFYLHEIAQPRIIHRDIKASNILLDKDLQARIADFGLALLFPEDQTHITTMHIVGTK
jgi:serine/threonine protein kinase